MRQLILLFSMVATICLFQVEQTVVAQGWDLTWSDEFNGNSLDTSKWNAINNTDPTNNSLHAYLDSMVSVSGGNLVISSNDTPYAGFNYRSGQVISTSSQQYGRWEIRAKLPSTKGTWPAIWLLPDVTQHPWPSQGEIDIMENRGDQAHVTSSAYHYGTNPPFSHDFIYQEQKSFHGGSLQNYHNDFHTYAVEWESDQIRFYVDDVHHMTVRDSDTNGFMSTQTAGMNLILNTAIGGDFLDNPDGSSVFPQEFLIDSVHVYEESPAGLAPLAFENNDFETNNGSLAHWSTFGNALPNVQAAQEHVLDGNNSLKLFGQFDGEFNVSGVEQGITVSEGEALVAKASALVSSFDSLLGTSNFVAMKIDYYNKRHGLFGSSEYISSDGLTIADGSTINDQWLQHEIFSIVPAGAVEARLALVFLQDNDDGGSIHIDGVTFGLAIPEPSGYGLLVFATLLVIRRKRR